MIIINNEKFTDQPKRLGSATDAANLDKLFHALHFTVYTEMNTTAQVYTHKQFIYTLYTRITLHCIYGDEYNGTGTGWPKKKDTETVKIRFGINLIKIS